MSIQVHTDGSCHSNPGPGGYAAILQYDDGTPEAVVTGGEPSTTSNRMELAAALAALQKVVETPNPGEVTIYTDSQYLCKGFNEGWVEKWKSNGWINAKRLPAKNRDLWEQINILKEQAGQVAFIHVPGHSGNVLNERCDRLANDEANKATPKDTTKDTTKEPTQDAPKEKPKSTRKPPTRENETQPADTGSTPTSQTGQQAQTDGKPQGQQKQDNQQNNNHPDSPEQQAQEHHQEEEEPIEVHSQQEEPIQEHSQQEEEPSGEHSQQEPQAPLPPPFSCQPHPRGTVITTPLTGPDSRPVDIYLIENDDGKQYLTDLAETINSMAPPEKHGMHPQEARATIQRICRDLNLKVSERHLIAIPSEDKPLTDCAFRLAQGRVQMLQMLTTSAIRQQIARADRPQQEQPAPAKQTTAQAPAASTPARPAAIPQR